jgi:hypothetical protein
VAALARIAAAEMTRMSAHTCRAEERKTYTLVALDLTYEEAAIELAEKIAKHTGCDVTVCDADGITLATIPSPLRN